METTPVPTIPPPPQKTKRFSAIFLVAILLIGLVAGGLIAYAFTYSAFNQRLNTIEGQLGLSQAGSGNGTNNPNTVFLLGDNAMYSLIHGSNNARVAHFKYCPFS